MPRIFEFDLLTLPAIAIFPLLVSERERPHSMVIFNIISVAAEK